MQSDTQFSPSLARRRGARSVLLHVVAQLALVASLFGGAALNPPPAQAAPLTGGTWTQTEWSTPSTGLSVQPSGTTQYYRPTLAGFAVPTGTFGVCAGAGAWCQGPGDAAGGQTLRLAGNWQSDQGNPYSSDLNGDGVSELLFVNWQGTIGGQIYWGGGLTNNPSWSATDRTDLPSSSGFSVAVADLNGDGRPEVILSLLATNSSIYWGQAGGTYGVSYSASAVTNLPTNSATGVAVADLNGDGRPEVIFANYSNGFTHLIDSYIYWGQAGGTYGVTYSTAARTVLPTSGGSGVAVADLNGDGRPEVIFSNTNDDSTFNVNSYIYWGQAGGTYGVTYSTAARTVLPTSGGSGVAVADLNGDGRPEVIFANFDNNSTRYLNSYVYWGQAGGTYGVSYSTAARTDLPGVGAQKVSVADLNNDGQRDVALLNYHGGFTRVFWGPLPTSGTATSYWDHNHGFGFRGLSLSDLNADNRVDLLIGRQGISPIYLSLYWTGGTNGLVYFHNTNNAAPYGMYAFDLPVQSSPGAYASFGSARGTNGNGFSQPRPTYGTAFPNYGVLESMLMDSGQAGSAWPQVQANTNIAAGTGITLFVAAGDNPSALNNPSWVQVGAMGNGAWTQSLSGVSGRYARYRVVLWRDRTTEASPALQDITFTYGNVPTQSGFNKNTPANGAGGQPVNGLNLSWTTVGDATFYEVCYDTNPNGTCNGSWQNVGNVSSFTLNGLTPGATYEWQVRACNSSGCNGGANNGAWWNFTVLNAPSSFNKTAPSNGATGQPANVTLQWGAASGVNHYRYCYSTTNGCTPSTNNGTNTSVNLTGLTPGATYYWQVRACADSGCTVSTDASGGHWSFTVVNAPSSFNKTAPSNGATGQPANVTLQWGASTGVNHYRYCYSTTSGCTPSTNNGTNTSVNLTGLTPGATYYWQVRACADSGCTVFTDADGGTHWSFAVVGAPSGFSKSSPSNGATGQPTNVTLQWGAASGVNHYRYCYSTTNGCTPSTNNGTNTSVNLTGLTPGATYYWQVRACADVGCTVFTDANGPGGHWNFTVVSAPSGSGFSKLNPAHTATNLPTNPTLSWGTAGGVVDKYEYCVSTTTSCGTWTDVGMNTSASVVGLAAGTLYYWQVRACNSAGCTEANSGSFWSFQTAATVGSFNKFAPSNGAINVNTNTAQLLWTAAANANDYKLCLGTAPNNCNIVGGGPGQFASLGNTYFRVLNDLPLQPNTTYYWQVLATNGTYTTPANGSTLAFWSFTTLPNGPDPFNKLSPSFNATNVPTQNVTFQWQAATGAVSYTVCVGAYAGDCSYSVTSTTTSAVLSGPLLAGATLVWQVTAHNAGGSTGADSNAWWPFTTVPNAPQAFTKINPPNNATDQPLGLNLTWQDTPDETYYSVCVGVNIGVCSLVNTTTTVASYALTGLDYGTQYFWQVSACNAGGCTAANNSVAWGFKTLNPPVPGPFQKTHPANGAVGAPTNPAVLQLTWTAADSSDGYEVCMGTVPGACDLSGGGFQDVGPYTARYINQLPFSVTLQPGTTYYWQVRAYSTLTATRTFADNGVDFYFVTQSSSGPAAFSKDAPLNGSFNLPTASLTLKWFAAAGATSYEVCAGTAVNSCDAMPGNAWLNVGSALSYTLSNLAPGTTYFWQVRAKNGSGTTPANGGVWWTFTTKNAHPPAEFAKQSPPHLATGVVTTGLTLSWAASTGATGYQVCIGSAPGLCEATGGWVNVGNNTSWVVTPALQAATTYWWQVQALGGTFSVQANGGQWWAFTTRPDGPADFSKQQPLQSAIGVPTGTAVLSWTTALGASNYEVCLGTQAWLCDVTGTWLNVGNVTAWNPPVLQAATTYWWQVRAVNSSGGRTQANGSVWWHFTTVPAFGPNPPAPFGKVSPLNNAANQPINLTLSWGAASGATGYEVCVGALPNDCSTSGGWVSVAGTSYALSGLSYDTTYWWQVRAVNANGQTLADSGAWWHFTTGNNPGAAGSAFNKRLPMHLATGVPTATAVLSWTASSGATGYRVCIGSAPGLCEATGGWVDVGNATSWAVTPALQAATTYWWQVRAAGLGFDIQADGGQWWAFTTANDPAPAPEGFGKLQPLQGASGVPTGTAVLSWQPSANASNYEVCVGTQADLCDVTGNWVSAGSATSWNAPSLQPATTYWWQVRAVNGSGQAQADGGAWWYFTTAAAASAPAPFGKVSPPNNAANQLTNLTLSWGAASGATGYAVCVGALPGDCSTTGGSWVNVAGTSYALSGLAHDTTYWWQVRAVNANGQTLADGGVWWRFTTGNNPASPLGTFGKSAPAANATGVLTNTTLSWSAAANAQRYTVCVGTLPGLCDVMNHVEVLAPATSLVLANAQAGRTYWWQVWAHDGNGAFLLADAGQWWPFTTANNVGSGPGGGPAEFQKVAPISGTMVGNSPLLSWTASGGAVGYYVCVGRAWGLCDVVNNAATAGLSHATNGLAPGTYWWQVTAVDAYGDTTQADGGARWQFIVVNNLLSGSLDNVDTRKEVTPTQVRIGDLVTYTIVLSNSGGVSVTVRVSDTLATALTLVGATPGYAQSGQTLVWENVLVPAGGTTELTVTAQVNTNALSNPTVNNSVVISSYADGEPPLVRDADPVDVEVYRAFLPVAHKPASTFAFVPVVIRP
ncbi:MAG: hypothetical protein KatS3mg052_0259 [Candidatus Roseilinea sp.]|nr:MAG: hypothetical protein KatS3mg052_0259 [Candidatus Roseilinea sp.]